MNQLQKYTWLIDEKECGEQTYDSLLTRTEEMETLDGFMIATTNIPTSAATNVSLSVAPRIGF